MVAALIPCLFAVVEINLAGYWNLTGQGGFLEPISCTAKVPGDVHSALLGAGLMKDPFFGRNEIETQWVAKRPWKFQRKFDLNQSDLNHANVILRLEDCDTFATVRVNGIEVGRTSDRFARWDLDSKGALKFGENTIEIEFESAWKVGDEKFKASGRVYPMSNWEFAWFNNGPYIRKPACHKGWDWGLAQMTVGPCGTVKLIASDGDRIDYVYTDQTFNADMTHCTLSVLAELETGAVVTNVVEIDNPSLWWPNGEGDQTFYSYDVPVLDQRCRGRVGLRKVELDSTDGAVCFKVNNRPIFMKGANWIPCDAFDARQTSERYRNLLGSAARVNMNMIRVWGGGQYEKDAFYDLCDELGILIWHDQMFSCAVYPGDNKFLEDVKKETVHQLKRLRDHASIALWCGDNECIGAARGWFGEYIPASLRPTYIDETKRRFAVQSAAVAEADPTRRFWPSSPCAGEADFEHDAWHDDSRGDMHLWTVWHENKPFSDYYLYRPRFCSEFGFQSFSSREVAETYTRSVACGDPDFEWHQKNVGGNDRIRKTFARYFREPVDMDGALYLSQVQQALAIKTAVEYWRTLRPHCMGALFWQLNDLWPVASWSSIEYGGKWKHLQYHAKRFFEPIMITARPVNGGRSLEIWAVNDLDECADTSVSVSFVTYAKGDRRAESAQRIVLPARSATKVADYELGNIVLPLDAGFVTMEITSSARGRSSLQRNDYFPRTFKESRLASAKIERKVEVVEGISKPTFKVCLETSAPTFFVWLNVKGIRGEFDDNSFTMLPGNTKVVTFTAEDDDVTLEKFRKVLTIRHLAES